MEFFETKLLPSILPSYVIWYRYIDDVLAFWPHSLNPNEFLSKLNVLNEHIQFTMEEEINSSLPFLDLHLFRDKMKISFSVYRKPTNVCSYLHYFSNHELRTKKAVFISFFLRGFRVCDLEHINTEFNRIYDIGRALQYPEYILDACREAAYKSFSGSGRNSNTRFNQHGNTIVLPYTNQFVFIRKILSFLNINVAFEYKNTLKSFLISNRPQETEKSSLYMVPCGTTGCKMWYIGQSGKELQVRLRQHQYSVRTNQNNNAISNHANSLGHAINWGGTTSIMDNLTYQQRQIIESCLISSARPGRIMNEHPGDFRVDPILINLISPWALSGVKNELISYCFS